MKKTNVLIVEDEFLIAKDLSLRLQSMGYRINTMASSSKEAWKELQKQQTDLCILSIQLMGREEGISLAHRINLQYKIPIVFFTSSNASLTIAKARDTKPSAYILKLFNGNELQKVIDLTISNFSNNKQNSNFDEDKNNALQGHSLFSNESIFVRKRERYYRVKYADILWIEAQSNYSVVVTAQEKYILAITLGKVATKLFSPDFIRVNRSFIVNRSQVNSIEGNSIFINDQRIPVSKNNRVNFFSYFQML